jgi:hypothetical protein
MSEDQELIARATEAFKARHKQMVKFELSLDLASALIAMVQLGMRHPEVGAILSSAAELEKFLATLIEQIDPEHGPIWALLNRGFNPTHDQRRRDVCVICKINPVAPEAGFDTCETCQRYV